MVSLGPAVSNRSRSFNKEDDSVTNHQKLACEKTTWMETQSLFRTSVPLAKKYDIQNGTGISEQKLITKSLTWNANYVKSVVSSGKLWVI